MNTKAIIIGGIAFALAISIYASHRPTAARLTHQASIKPENRIAPDFELKTLDGRTVKLSDFRGKAVVLNFWATYCGPCRVEMPWLKDLYQQYHSQGLEIVGVSMDDDGEQQRVADFVHEMKVNYTILLGNHAVGDAYAGVRFLPQTFFIDRDGRTSSFAIGMKSKSEFETVIKDLLATAR